MRVMQTYPLHGRAKTRQFQGIAMSQVYYDNHDLQAMGNALCWWTRNSCHVTD